MPRTSGTKDFGVIGASTDAKYGLAFDLFVGLCAELVCLTACQVGAVLFAVGIAEKSSLFCSAVMDGMPRGYWIGALTAEQCYEPLKISVDQMHEQSPGVQVTSGSRWRGPVASQPAHS